MHRITLVAATAAASIALLAGCSVGAPEAEPTTPADLSADVPTLRADIPTEAEPTPAPTPVQGEIPEGYGYIFDDTGVLSVVTPTAWADVDGRPFSTTDGREWASIIATPDAAAYPSDWNTAGIEFSGTLVDGQLDEAVAKQFLTDLSAPLDENCDALKTAEPYDDGLYAGWFSNWTGCGDGETFGIVVVAQDPQFHHLVFLRGKFVTAEDNGETFTQIFTTFQSTQGLDKASTDDRVFTGE